MDPTRPPIPSAPPTRRPGGAVVKLGGSVLTDKSGEVPRLEEALLEALAVELTSVESRPLVLIHGAGAFGHQIAEARRPHAGIIRRAFRHRRKRQRQNIATLLGIIARQHRPNVRRRRAGRVDDPTTPDTPLTGIPGWTPFRLKPDHPL